jgi:hypothetical protein
MQIVGGQIRGGHTGLDLRAATTLIGMHVGLASTGIRAAAAAAVTLDEVTIDTETVGVTAEPGSAVSLNNSSVHAPHATRGDVHLTGSTMSASRLTCSASSVCPCSCSPSHARVPAPAPSASASTRRQPRSPPQMARHGHHRNDLAIDGRDDLRRLR